MKKFMFDGVKNGELHIRELEGEYVGDAFVVNGVRLSPKSVFESPDEAKGQELDRLTKRFSEAYAASQKAGAALNAALRAQTIVKPWGTR